MLVHFKFIPVPPFSHLTDLTAPDLNEATNVGIKSKLIPNIPQDPMIFFFALTDFFPQSKDSPIRVINQLINE